MCEPDSETWQVGGEGRALRRAPVAPCRRTGGHRHGPPHHQQGRIHSGALLMSRRLGEQCRPSHAPVAGLWDARTAFTRQSPRASQCCSLPCICVCSGMCAPATQTIDRSAKPAGHVMERTRAHPRRRSSGPRPGAHCAAHRWRGSKRSDAQTGAQPRCNTLPPLLLLRGQCTSSIGPLARCW